MAKTFYMKLGNCKSPVLSALNSNDGHSLKTEGIIKFNNATHALEIQAHVDAARERLNKIGTNDCRKLVIHSHGSGIGKLVVAGTDGQSRVVSAQRLCEFLQNNTRLNQNNFYVTTIYVLACGIGNNHVDYPQGFLQDLATQVRALQGHAVRVYGSYHWIDLREGSFFLYQGEQIQNLAELTAENNVNNGTMAALPYKESNLDNWVGYNDNFRCVNQP